MVKIAVFASGAGSNALRIIEYFKGNNRIQVALIASENPHAGALGHGRTAAIETYGFTREELDNGKVAEDLLAKGIDWVVLAGFLKRIPANFIQAFSGKIVNIHPSLLPKFGGKGMYGSRVHKAVEASGELKSGITIHFVNEHYDEGQVLFQAEFAFEKGTVAEVIESEVRKLELLYYAPVLEGLILGMANGN